jgi:FKBP-type peptidyl-prolyl cis-trans isomerase FklB
MNFNSYFDRISVKIGNFEASNIFKIRTMKKLLILSAVLGMATMFSCNKLSTGGKLANEVDTASYSYGILIGKSLKEGNLTDIKMNLVMKGVDDVLSGKHDTMKVYMAQGYMEKYYRKVQQQKIEETYAENKKAGIKFLEENAKKEGVITLPSGLQYKVIKEGTGPKPNGNDIVNVFYTGSLIDGTVFESNKGKESVPLSVSSVIPGWSEALAMMPVGSIWEIYIPQELGYGAQNMGGGKIKPFSALVFEIELVSIQPKPAPSEKKK